LSAELFGFLEERLAGTEDIRACGARDYYLSKLILIKCSPVLHCSKRALAGGEPCPGKSMSSI